MPSLHDRAKDVFLAALECPASDRPAFVADACAGDERLRREVESLLEFHEEERRHSGGTGSVGGADADEETDPFVPGHVFAGRYRMITRIGRGGMGDVWRADDLVLETPVALKLLFSAGPEARQRILNEVRLARRITHPAVCRVFDVGEAEGRVFFSMELVHGEDLATLLKRAGRLPSEKVVEIGHQLSAGLHAAHLQRVLHRDLKPGNVLMDENGHVRITDFGIAVTRTEGVRHTLVGTPAYMAPEQLRPDGELSERTDIYALGVLLYELVVGQHPFKGSRSSTAPPRPSELVADVNPRLERVIMQALSLDPRERPSSADAVAARLPRATTRGVVRIRRWWVAAAACAAVVAAAALTAPLLLQRGAGAALTEQDTIVLADFTNTTGDPVFDGALKVALAVALEQSPFLKVFPDQRVQEALRLMERSPDERVTRTIAREIARREHLKALLAGSITPLGTHYVLTIEAVNAETGDVMAREQVEAAGKEQVLTSLGSSASKLREKLGESLASIKRFDVPLPRATTPSLEALHAYSLALDQGRVVQRLESIPHLQRAIELDPEFALAQALLSGVYANTGRRALAPAFSRQAFELRDRVSERERFVISWRYYLDVEQAWDKALELARSWTASYPREAFAFNSLGIASGAFGERAEGVKALREAIRLDPAFTTPYANLGGALIALGRVDEAAAVVDDAQARGYDFIGVWKIAYWLAFLKGDSEGMARALARARRTPEALESSNWEPQRAAFEGRFREAHELYRQAVQAALLGNYREFAAQWSVQDVEIRAITGECADALPDVAAALEFSRDNFTLERAARALALCGASAQAEALTSELATRFPSATLTNRIHLPLTAAALALHRGDARRALQLLDTLKPYDRAPAAELWPPYLRGLAYLRLKDARAAASEFQIVLDYRGAAPLSVLYPLARLGLARSEAMGHEVAAAGKAYDEFLSLWRSADQNLPPLKEAREEFARLR
jgi:tetratricopeptide (TPR) repeat protein